MRKLYIWLSLLVGIVLFAILLVHIPWQDALKVLTEAKPEYLTVYLGASAAILVLHSWRWRVILKAKGVNVPLYNLLSYRMAGNAVSFVLPGPKIGGEAVRAGLVSRHTFHRKKTSFSKALSTVMLDRSVEFQTFVVLFFIGVLWLALHGGIPAHLKTVMVAAAVLLVAITLVLTISMYRGKPLVLHALRKFPFARNLHKELHVFEQTIASFYREDKLDFILSHCIAAVAWFLSFIEYKYLLLLLGYDVPLYGIFIIYSFVGFAYAIPIPLALGSLEAAQATAFTLLGLPAGSGLILAFITRLRDMILTLLGFMVLIYYGIAPRPFTQKLR